MSVVEALPRSPFLGWCTHLQLLKMEVLAAEVPASLQNCHQAKESRPQPLPGRGQWLTDTAAQMLVPCREGGAAL